MESPSKAYKLAKKYSNSYELFMRKHGIKRTHRCRIIFDNSEPDVDLIIYHPSTCRILAVISSKVTLRERIAQTGYWKMKLASDKVTEHIRVFFVTPDEDGTLTTKSPPKKGRAIVETDTDGSYVMTEAKLEESNKVKMFDKFIDDLKILLTSSKARD